MKRNVSLRSALVAVSSLVAVVLVGGMVSPGTAGAATPASSPTCSPGPNSLTFSVTPQRVAAGDAVTASGQDVQSCPQNPPTSSPYTLFAKPSGATAWQPVQTAQEDTSGTFRFDPQHPQVTTAYTIGAVADPETGPYAYLAKTVTVDSTSQTYTCPSARIPDGSDFGPGTNITARPGQVVDLPWRQESATGTVTLTRTVPEPVQQVRAATGTTGTFQVRVGQNHRLTLDGVGGGGQQCPGVEYVISVTPDVSIAARRNAPRDYTFSGRVFPARSQLVTLYLSNGAGRRLAAQQRVGGNGVYRINRKFLGSGRFEVSAVVSPSDVTVAGSSTPRPTVIH